MVVQTILEVLELVKNKIVFKWNKTVSTYVKTLFTQIVLLTRTNFLGLGRDYLLVVCLIIKLLLVAISTIDSFVPMYGLASWDRAVDSPVGNVHLGFLYEKQRF